MRRLGFLLLVVGTLMVVGWAGFQFFGDSVISEVKKSTQSEVVEVPAEGNAEEPVQVRQYTIRVANEGGSVEMDYCTGGFTKMIHYKGLNGKYILSAHNNCGGDVILPIELGDRVVIEGQGTYVVSELRDTPKDISTDVVADMDGEILLQTCYYRVNSMKFAALKPVE